jgi:hypothetical protein
MMILMAAMLLVACRSYDDEGRHNKFVCMPVYLSIPAADIGGQTRAPGDPGNYERFELPRYLWLYMVEDNGGTTEVVAMETAKLLDKEGWSKEKLGTDSVYTYSAGLSVELQSNRSGSARIYALMSAYDLYNVTPITKNSSTEGDVLDITFDLPDPSSLSTTYGEVVRNIYSSPFNLKPNGEYYGTVQNYAITGESPYVENFILYHVAAKLDVIWNVADEKQGTVRLNKLDVTSLKKTGCKVFSPLENNSVPESTYDESITIDVGAQWYGRHSFYIIPYNNNNTIYPVKLNLYKNGNTSTADKSVTIDAEYKSGTPANDIFTPWIVAPLQITTDLTP